MINGKEPLIVNEKVSRFEQVNFFAISFQLGNLLKSYKLEINFKGWRWSSLRQDTPLLS